MSGTTGPRVPVSRWGPTDQAGALNEITAAKVLEATALVRLGHVHELAHVLHENIPAFPGRTFRQYLTTSSHQVNRRSELGGPAGLGRNNVNWIVEQISATQQMGTHLDGLNHLQAGDRTYNGFALADIVEDWGTSKLGIETLPQIVTRGLLLDVARRIALTGCDTWSYGPDPAEDEHAPFVVPQTLNVDHGIVVVENLRLHEAAQAGLREFMLVISHAKIRGATGAWVCPLAIV